MSLFIRKGNLNNSGFSLVEVLVAIVILAIISLPVLSTFSNAARINAKARRTENANTAINNIVEEARIVSLDNLADGNGKYNYQTLGTSNNTYLVADKGQQYFTGVDGEKYFIRTKFNSNPYNSNANAAAGNKKTNNDINSAGLSVYADITASNSYVYRDDSADTEAIKYFSDLNKTAVSRTDISKSIDVTISIKEKSSNHFTQDISVNVTYKYIKEAGKYPDYTARSMDMVTWEFPAHVTGSGTSTVYTISGELKDNAKNMYIFYTPYQGEAVSGQSYEDTITEAEMTSDSVPTERININYDYPSTYSLTSTDHIIKDVNVYLFEMEKVVKTSDSTDPSKIKYKKMGTNMSNVYINGVKAISSANGTTPITVYSNIVNWNKALTKHINNKDVLYQMTVDVWLWRDVKDEIGDIVDSNTEPTAEKITTLTTTKED